MQAHESGVELVISVLLLYEIPTGYLPTYNIVNGQMLVSFHRVAEILRPFFRLA